MRRGEHLKLKAELEDARAKLAATKAELELMVQSQDARAAQAAVDGKLREAGRATLAATQSDGEKVGVQEDHEESGNGVGSPVG